MHIHALQTFRLHEVSTKELDTIVDRVTAHAKALRALRARGDVKGDHGMPDCRCGGSNPDCFVCGGFGWVAEKDARVIAPEPSWGFPGHRNSARPDVVTCQTCGKKVRGLQGLEGHQRAKHPTASQAQSATTVEPAAAPAAAVTSLHPEPRLGVGATHVQEGTMLGAQAAAHSTVVQPAFGSTLFVAGRVWWTCPLCNRTIPESRAMAHVESHPRTAATATAVPTSAPRGAAVPAHSTLAADASPTCSVSDPDGADLARRILARVALRSARPASCQVCDVKAERRVVMLASGCADTRVYACLTCARVLGSLLGGCVSAAVPAGLVSLEGIIARGAADARKEARGKKKPKKRKKRYVIDERSTSVRTVGSGQTKRPGSRSWGRHG